MHKYIELSRNDQEAYCRQAGSLLNLPPVSIEKDFWVCWTLQTLFSLPTWGEQFSFKGGTSLSKAWKLIHRFSEDIDIVIDRQFFGFPLEPLNGNQLKQLRHKCGEMINNDLAPMLRQAFGESLPADADWSLVQDQEDHQTLLFTYPGILSQSARYIKPLVKIEMNARSDAEPTETPSIQPYVCEVFPDQLGSCRFSPRTVVARRTFWEKAMILHEERFRPAHKPRTRSLARHYYDVHQLIQAGIGDRALEDLELFNRIVEHRKIFFKYTWVDYTTHAPGTFRLQPIPEQHAAWESDYRAMQHEMFFGEVPDFREVLTSIAQFEERFNSSC